MEYYVLILEEIFKFEKVEMFVCVIFVWNTSLVKIGFNLMFIIRVVVNFSVGVYYVLGFIICIFYVIFIIII